RWDRHGPISPYWPASSLMLIKDAQAGYFDNGPTPQPTCPVAPQAPMALDSSSATRVPSRFSSASTLAAAALLAPVARADWGRVTLVGAGPGDPELLTLKAARVLANARVVLYDHLVSNDVLAHVPVTADLIYVGKQSRNHTLPQEGIIDLMVRL